jgi:exopolysaccharide biosynthesis polyprenyl glycosylphosphotransferase
MLEINSFNMTSGRWFMKRAFDLVSCTLAVILLSPLYILLALLVKLSSPGPVFYKQKRVTIDGKIFTMLKFRSMRIDMKEQGGAHWTEENDPRITKIGRLLRRTSLDEIPQFFNVIQGSMSLIGPRPERPELEKEFVKIIPGYNMRHRMKAGISGWAQVNGLRGNTSLEKRIEYDLYYIQKWSFMFDMRIVFLTFFKGFINKNAY